MGFWRRGYSVDFSSSVARARRFWFRDKAIVSDQTRKIVFTLGEDNTIVPKPVALGALKGKLRVITSGLTKDDKVIINGIANPAVRPGAKVTPEDGEITKAELQ